MNERVEEDPPRTADQWSHRTPDSSGGLGQSPNPGRRQFQTVAAWVPKVKGFAPLGPIQFFFNLDTMTAEVFFPELNLGLAHRKAAMADPARAMAGNIDIRVPLFGGVRIEE